MYKNQLSQHFTYIYSKRKLPGTHNMYRGDAVLSPPRNHGSILLGNKIYRYGTCISSQMQKLKY